jgi:hypothetical protein
MESIRPIWLPGAVAAAEARDGAEVSVAIALVASGAARRVTISGLTDPRSAARRGLAESQRVGVSFRLSHDEASGSLAVVVESIAE